jgi:uncharacterized iron-regulated membrane protein
MSTIKDPVRPPTSSAPPARAEPDPSVPRSGGLFRSFWRWHFYASAVVIPVLLMLSVTGLIYLFRFQLEPLMHGDLMRVSAPPGRSVQPYEAQRLAVAKARPDDTIVSMTEPAARDHSTRFTVETADGQTRDVFVDPYRADVLGALDPDSTLSGAAILLHGELMAGNVGDAVIELGACWAIVMAITGYYLVGRGWRARRRQRRAAAATARLRSTHAVTGAGIGVGLLFLVVSGLPWTGIWGAQVQRIASSSGGSLWSQDPGALSNPTSTLDESLPHSHGVIPWAQEKMPVPPSRGAGQERAVADIDTAVAVAATAGLRRPLTVALPGGDTGVFSTMGYAFEDPGQERTVHIDRYGGRVVGAYGYEQYPTLAKVVAQSIALHEGRRFGTANLVVTTVFCLGVIASCITGPIMWWRRRPRGSGQLGAPRGASRMPGGPALLVVLVVLGLLLPVFGVSLVVVLLLDRFVLRRIDRMRRFFGAAPRGA